MFRLVVVLSAVILLHGVNSHIFPKQFVKLTKGMQPLKIVMRQDLDNINSECVQEKLQRLPADCARIFLTSGVPDDPLQLVGILVCSPECGQRVQESLNDCGATAAVINAFSGLCGINTNGAVCYNLWNNFTEFADNLNTITCPSTEMCSSTCRISFSNIATQQGCCLSAFLNFTRLQLPTDVETSEGLLHVWNIDVPGVCTTSTISGNMDIDGGNNSPGNNSANTTLFQVSYLAILSALLLTTLLG